MVRVIDFRGGELVYDRDDQLVLSMGLTANHALDYAVGNTRANVVPMIGRFGLMTPGRRFRVGLRGECTVVQLVMPRDTVTAWLSEDHEVDAERIEIGWGHSLDDPSISRMVCAARAAGPAEEEPVLRAIVARLMQRFSSSRHPAHMARGGLAAGKLRRVVERIEDDPARPVSVEDLARVASMSPFHFAHQFTLTTGRSPYRFLIERRLSRAIGLLRDPRLSIADIATRCGFSHGAHLSRQLQRVVGQSPSRLRRAMLL